MPTQGNRTDRTVFWGVPGFPKKVKDAFIFCCKIEGKDYKKVVANLMRAYVYDRRDLLDSERK